MRTVLLILLSSLIVGCISQHLRLPSSDGVENSAGKPAPTDEITVREPIAQNLYFDLKMHCLPVADKPFNLPTITSETVNQTVNEQEHYPLLTKTLETDSKPDTSDATLDAPDLWMRMRKGFQLDLELKNPRIESQLNWYVKNPRYIERTFGRAQRYLHHIVQAIEEHGLPLELALLPVVESAFDPFAYSHGRASGLWQFIPGTGKMYGLHQNWWYDGRRDVLASTQAAIDYMSYLSRRFDGNWLYALASYNSGSGRVSKAIRNNKKRGKAVDFWSLKLPRETRAYVPKLIAIAKLVANPEKYNITLPHIPDDSYL